MVCISNVASAQKIQYSSENVFTDYPDRLQLVGNISGNQHLLSIIYKSEPVIFIFDKDLEYKSKITIPYKFPERAEVRVVTFDDYYYLYMHPPFTGEYYFWKIDGGGNITDMSIALQNLLSSQSRNVKLGFQFIRQKNDLWMVYHTALGDIQKHTLAIVQTDSLLKPVFYHEVKYEFKRELERLNQELIMFGRYLLVLKSSKGNTALELMKVNLATGYTISNTFNSSGYMYSQAGLNYNNDDSTVTITAMLIEPRNTAIPKRFVFVSRLNKILIEDTPFTVLRSQFVNNTNASFVLVNGGYKWQRLRIERMSAQSVRTESNNTTLFKDITMPDSNFRQSMMSNDLYNKVTTTRSYPGYSEDLGQAVRFSILDKGFKISHDTLMKNNKNAYSVQPEQFCSFSVDKKNYLLLIQRFRRKGYGIMMVNSDDNGRLRFRDVRVNDQYNYFLSKAQIIPQKGIVIPYSYKREAGLIKITIE